MGAFADAAEAVFDYGMETCSTGSIQNVLQELQKIEMNLKSFLSRHVPDRRRVSFRKKRTVSRNICGSSPVWSMRSDFGAQDVEWQFELYSLVQSKKLRLTLLRMGDRFWFNGEQRASNRTETDHRVREHVEGQPVVRRLRRANSIVMMKSLRIWVKRSNTRSEMKPSNSGEFWKLKEVIHQIWRVQADPFLTGKKYFYPRIAMMCRTIKMVLKITIW
jgi:hypothetical protein